MSELKTLTREIQNIVGVTPDGIYGPNTAKAILRKLKNNQEEAPAIKIAEEQEGVEYQAARAPKKRVRTKAKERDNHRPRKRKNRSFGSHLGPRMPTTSKGTRSEEKRLRSQT